MPIGRHVCADALRAMFSAALSDMYKAEVPHYGALIDLVADINAGALAGAPALESRLRASGELARLGVERHGAIRVGTADELAGIRRLFAVLGMMPVGYYDLSAAGLPVHSTAFRPIDEAALRQSPFRVFTSLLRLELVDDAGLRQVAAASLARRRILTPRCLKLVALCEQEGGLEEREAHEFISEALETFRWKGEVTVFSETYRAMHKVHPLLADIVCFKGPHINHLTLRTLDIDAAHAAMAERQMTPKAIIEGPPRRACPILLRQTSFRAILEPIVFEGADGATETGVHQARFGEIEQRGIALTAKGRALYDQVLEKVLASVRPLPDGSNKAAYGEALACAFEAFPDDEERLRADGLAFFRYAPTRKGLSQAGSPSLPGTIEELLRAGYVEAEPVIYEDFLPVSAAGIFRSNLGERDEWAIAKGADRAAFEAALGAPVADEMALYAETEARSKAESLEALGLATSG